MIMLVMVVFPEMSAQFAGFTPQGDGSHCHQDQKRDPADQDRKEKLLSQDICQLRHAGRTGRSVHENRDDSQRPARADCAELIEEVCPVAMMVMIVVVSHD
jgi:hypothetical protein